MPELPEVETIRRRLQAVLPGRSIHKVDVFAQKSFQGDLSPILNQPILAVERRGKITSFLFQNQFRLAVHLKMTGQLLYQDEAVRLGGGHPSADWIAELPSKHTRVTLQLSDNASLFFNDQRLFGWLKVVSPAEYEQLFIGYGPDSVDEQFTVEYFWQKISSRSVPIKQLIMDNQVVAGIGNIYACDSLNAAKISPFRLGKQMTLAEANELVRTSRRVIARAVELGGTTFDGLYVGIDGFAGGYQHEVVAYGREGKPCYNCGSPLLKTKLAGRGTYYCGVCQV